MSEREHDQQIDLQTQEIIKSQIGDLVLTAARLRAEVLILRAEVNGPKPVPEPPA